MQASDINAIESEAGIIATLIHHPEYTFYSEYLLPNHFTDKANQCVYTAICDLSRQGIKTIDPYNIIEDLNSSEATRKFADELSIERLQELVDMSDVIARNTVEEYKMLVGNVMDAAFRRDTFQCLKECQALCYDTSTKDIEQKIYTAIDDVMMEFSTADETPEYVNQVEGLWEEIKSRQGTGYAGIPFKFPALNDYVTIERGELVIFGAQQKVGKSIMLLNCAVDLLRQGYSVLYIDSELSSRLFTARLLSHLTGIPYRDLTAGNYTDDEEDRIKAALEWIKTRTFNHVYMPFFDQQSIYTLVKRTHHIHPIDVLIIDYFKSTGNEMDAFQTYASMGRCVDLIKNEIAGAMNIAAIGAAQATINNKLADSAKIARNASTVIMLVDKTEDEINEDGAECGNKKMIVTVNRNGMQHAAGEWIDLQFNGNLISYEQARQHTAERPF